MSHIQKEMQECIIRDNIVIGKKLKPEDNVVVGQKILDSFNEHPNFIGMIDAESEEKVTFAQMKERSVRCALWLRKRGIRHDDVVVASTPIQMNDYVPYLATMYLNAIFNPWYYNASEGQVQHYLDTCQPKVIFASEESIDKLVKIAESKRFDCKFIAYDKHPRYSSLEEIMAEQSQEEVDNFECAAGPLEPRKKTSLILFSSGTTSAPKAIVLPYQSQVRMSLQMAELSMQRSMICLWYATLDWIVCLLCISSAIRLRCTRIVHKDFDVELAAKLVEKYKIEFMWLRPYVLTLWQLADIFTRYDFSHVKVFIIAGTKCNKSTLEHYQKILPYASLINVYGITEAGGALSRQTKSCKHIDSVGFLCDGVELKVIDSNNGEILGPNQEGELYFKKDSVMLNYLRNVETTNETIDEEGWLRSGDIGYYDEDGELMIGDRMKAMIKTKSWTISPYEFEECLIEHPDVRDCAVVGVEHPIDIERPFVFVVKASDSKVTTEQLLKFAANKNEYFGLTSGLVFVDEIPYTQTGKKCLGKLLGMARAYVKQ